MVATSTVHAMPDALEPAPAPVEPAVVDAAIDGALPAHRPVVAAEALRCREPVPRLHRPELRGDLCDAQADRRRRHADAASFYRDALDSGFVGDEDIAAALARTPETPALPSAVAGVRAALARPPMPASRHRAVVATVAEVLDTLAAGIGRPRGRPS